METNKSERSSFGSSFLAQVSSSSFLVTRSGYITVELVDGRIRDVRPKTKCG